MDSHTMAIQLIKINAFIIFFHTEANIDRKCFVSKRKIPGTTTFCNYITIFRALRQLILFVCYYYS